MPQAGYLVVGQLFVGLQIRLFLLLCNACDEEFFYNAVRWLRNGAAALQCAMVSALTWSTTPRWLFRQVAKQAAAGVVARVLYAASLWPVGSG